MVTLDKIREQGSADLYPRHTLTGCKDALVLFAAAWHGKQDAVWIADAGLDATCVDTDQFKLMQMEDVYPRTWEFVCADAFEYVARVDREWDVVSVDCPTGAFGRCAELLPLWSLIARKTIILGTDGRELKAPYGWNQTERMWRSRFNGGTYWAVFENAR